MEGVFLVNDLFIMMRYPATMGGLGEGELDQVFGAIMDTDIMKDKNCTFGASMTECDGRSCPMVPITPPGSKSLVSSLVSKYECLDGETRGSVSPRHPSASSLNSASSGSLSETTRGFYCKSATANCKKLEPTLLVELYTSPDIVINNTFVESVSLAIQTAIQTHLLTDRTRDTSIRFLFSAPARVL